MANDEEVVESKHAREQRAYGKIRRVSEFNARVPLAFRGRLVTLPRPGSSNLSSVPSEMSPLLKPSLDQGKVLLVREQQVSLENLSPDPSSQFRKSSPVVATFNLVATVCGGGVLSLPLAFSRAGIIPTTLLMIYAAGTTDFSLYLLVACARRTGAHTYGEVAQSAYGSGASIVTTATLAIMLFGSLIAYQVLVRDVWAPVILRVFPIVADFSQSMEWSEQKSANILLGVILLLSLPLLLKSDLHSLRYTCYIGFASCALLMLAVMYRAQEKVGKRFMAEINWYSDNPADIMFAFPIVALCFFCSYNVLAVHSQLIQPTRERIRHVIGWSMIICFVLFYTVGLCGYIYAGKDTADNLLLNFPLDDMAILGGRGGFCLTLMFGLPLILLPCREAATSIPLLLISWRRDSALIESYDEVTDAREEGAHLVINGVDFDSAEPVLLARNKNSRHESVLLKYDEALPTRTESRSLSGAHVVSEDQPCRTTKETTSHLAYTLVILASTYGVAIVVPGVAPVWSIFGSSMAIWIAFIVPTGCYLKVRRHKGITIKSMYAWCLLVISCLSAVACTRSAIMNIMAGGSFD